MEQLWLVLVFGLLMGVGAVSLWPVVLLAARWLVLGAGPGLGTVLGDLALHEWLLRMGSIASAMSCGGGDRSCFRRRSSER